MTPFLALAQSLPSALPLALSSVDSSSQFLPGVYFFALNILSAVQSLQKQHNAFLLELTSHESQIAAVGDVAQELVDGHHFATDTIVER